MLFEPGYHPLLCPLERDYEWYATARGYTGLDCVDTPTFLVLH